MHSDSRSISRPPRWSVAMAAFWLAGAGLAQPALAKSTESAVLDNVIPLEIPVASNGTSYTTVPWNGNILADIHVEIDSGWSGHIKNWKTWLRLFVPGGEDVELPQYDAGASYPVFQRPHTVDVVEHLLVPAVAYNTFIVTQCNKLADSLRQDGLTDQQIFGQDRAIDLWVSPRIEVDYSGIVNPDFVEASLGSPPDIQIICQKWQGSAVTAAGALQSGFQVTGAELFIAPAYQNLTADCPVTVPLVAEFTATNAGNLQFRFVSAGGKASQLRQVSITDKTGGVYQALYEEHIQVPLAPANGNSGGQSGGGGIVNQQAGGGLAVQTQPEEPLFPTPPSSGSMDQVQQNPVSGNLHQESFRVEVVNPATGVVSDYAGYRITCKPKAAGIATPNSLQMQPKPPQPGSVGATTVIGSATTPPAALAQRRPQVQAAPQVADLTSGLKADIRATTLGFVLGGGPKPWGSTVVIDRPQLASATGVGPGRNLCRFAQAGYRPFNTGDVQSGPFKNRVYRGSATVDQSVHNLAPKQTDGWRSFPMELPSGRSVIRVVMDADKQIDESDENNTFSIRVNVKLDCGGKRDVLRRKAPERTPSAPALRLAPRQQLAPPPPRLPQRQ